jgi:hypothetical protein
MLTKRRYLELLKNFDSLPLTAIVPIPVAAAWRGISEKTTNYERPPPSPPADRFQAFAGGAHGCSHSRNVRRQPAAASPRSTVSR